MDLIYVQEEEQQFLCSQIVKCCTISRTKPGCCAQQKRSYRKIPLQTNGGKNPHWLLICSRVKLEWNTHRSKELDYLDPDINLLLKVSWCFQIMLPDDCFLISKSSSLLLLLLLQPKVFQFHQFFRANNKYYLKKNIKKHLSLEQYSQPKII